jgi:hypothetical protein
VFVLAQAALDEIAQPHLDRTVLEVDRTAVQRLELTRARAGSTPERVAIRRDGEVWRTDAGTPVDRARVNALLDRLAQVRAPRIFGYGPPPPDARLGQITLALTLAASGTPDAGATRPSRVVRVVLGATFGAGTEAGVYTRLEGLDATLSIPADVAAALREFRL